MRCVSVSVCARAVCVCVCVYDCVCARLGRGAVGCGYVCMKEGGGLCASDLLFLL